jgi:hypothetical protein
MQKTARTMAGALPIILLAASAFAQPTPPPPEDLPPPGQAAPAPDKPATPPAPHRLNGRQRFDAANTTHDGKLTLEQAQQAHWMAVARHFADIDQDHKGYITLQDLHVWTAARRAARQGQQQGGPPAQ